jgi:hypothetical protein
VLIQHLVSGLAGEPVAENRSSTGRTRHDFHKPSVTSFRGQRFSESFVYMCNFARPISKNLKEKILAKVKKINRILVF